MLRTGFWLLVGFVVVTALASAGPRDPKLGKLALLRLEYREAVTRHRALSVRREAQVRVLQRALRLRNDEATRWVIAMTRATDNVDLQRDALRLLAEEVSHHSEVVQLFREFMSPKHPLRTLAREFLLSWAIRKGERPWLLRLFESGDTEDRFLAMETLGQIGAPETLECAWRLLRDDKWIVRASTVVHCGTLATAVRRHEGGDAARLLLLLRRDPRFRPVDAVAVRQATRTWHYIDLARYIEIRELSHPDGVQREQMARFMGRAGFEGARAPLLALAKNKRERIKVREAAAEALGGLTLARGDLVRELSQLLVDSEADVRLAAVRALANLRVKQAVAALLPLLDTQLAPAVREALAKRLELPVDTDWGAWLKSEDCRLPQGT